MLAADGTSSTASATAAVQLIRPITVNKSADLTFGSIVKPSTGTGTVAVSANGSRAVTGTGAAALTSAAATAARFVIDGEGGQAITVTVARSFALKSSGNPDLTVTTTNDLPGGSTTQTLPASLGSDGSLTVNVGGAFDVSSATPTASYSGQFSVTAAYN